MSSVGQAVGGVVGAVVGFFVGGPQGALYGAQLGMGVGTIIDPPKGPNIKGPRLSDLTAQTSTYGAPLPRIYGTVATFGNVFWLENDKLKETSKKNKSGGKGGGGGTTKTFNYSATFAVGLCEGPIAGIRRLWVGAKLIYDAGSDDLETIIASNEAAKNFKLYLGDEDQMPDPRMQADKGVDNTPAYRGRAYIVMYDYPLADHGNSLVAAQVKAEVIQVGTVTEPEWENIGAPTSATYRGVARGDMSWVAVGPGGLVTVSREGREWTDVEIPIGGTVYGVTYGSGLFVAVGYGRVLKSPTGYGWDSSAAPGALSTYRAITSSGGTFVAVGVAGAVMVSYNGGSSFEYVTTGITVSLYGACHDGEQFVAVGEGGSIFLSIDGGEWWPAASPVSSDLFGVAHESGVLCAVGDAGVIITSTDGGATWIEQVSGTSAQLSAVTYGGDRWYATSGFLAGDAVFVSSDATTWSEEVTQSSGQKLAVAYDSSMAITVGVSGQIQIRLDARLIAGEGIPLSQIIEAEIQSSRVINMADIDASELTDTVRGYRVAQPGAIRGAIDPLQAAWPFDIVQSGYQIKFLRRGKASVAEIPATKLDARPFGDAPTQELMTVREMDMQLPREVSLKYLDVAREYDQGEQRDARMNTDAVNRRDIDLAIVMNANEAKQTAEVLLYLWWLERYDASFVLPPEYIALEPADVITVTGKWGEYELRLTSVTYLPDGRLECQAKYNSATIYESTATGEEGSAGGATIGLAGPSAYRLLDIPLLTDSLNEPGFPAAMSGYTTGWPGGVLYRSGDGGQTFDDIQGFTAPVSMAFARGTIGAGPTNVVDAASVLTVDVLSGEIESVTELQMLNGANHFAYGADGRWEIIAAQNAVEQADGSYVLTNFLRGRFGTEWAMTTHVAGDVLVLVSDIDMAWIAMNSGLIGQSRLYRGITSGKAIDSDSDREFIYQGVNLKPLSPAYLNGNRHPSTNDWALTWIRRGRVSPEWRDLVNVPVGEETEAYEIDVFSSSAYTTVVRTIEVTAATAAYTSAQQVADHGSNQSTLYLRIYQMSATVGRGFAIETSITR